MKKHILIVIFSFLFSSQVLAWTETAGFESGIVGEHAKGHDAFFSGTNKYTVFTDKFVHTGNKAAEVGIDAGTKGFGEWGGAFTFPEPLHEGEEIWFRTYTYYPLNFDFTAGGVGLKTMRIHTASSDNGNEGYFDVLVSNQGGALTVGSEITPHFYGVNDGHWKNIGEVVPKGTWQAYEMYVKFSSIRGQGIYRVWQNGKLILEDKSTNTLRSSTSKSNFIYMWTWWNDGAPKSQKAYIDNVVVTTERPPGTDSHGNPYIGLLGNPPAAPSNVR